MACVIMQLHPPPLEASRFPTRACRHADMLMGSVIDNKEQMEI